MKRILILMMVVGLIFGSVATAEAGKKKKKKKTVKVETVVKGTYACPCGVRVAGVGPGFVLSGGEGGFTLPTSSDHKYVSLELTDEAGQAVYFDVSQNLDGDPANEAETDVGTGCGATEEPLEIPAPGSELVVFVFSGTCGTDPTPSLATGGTYEAVLSNMP